MEIISSSFFIALFKDVIKSQAISYVHHFNFSSSKLRLLSIFSEKRTISQPFPGNYRPSISSGAMPDLYFLHPCGPGAQASVDVYLIISDLGYPLKINLRHNTVLVCLFVNVALFGRTLPIPM